MAAPFAQDDHAAEDPGPLDLSVNERDYIIPAQDAKGHHIRLYCRAQPAVGRLVADVHASRKYPFRTVGDLVRWCVVVGVKRLATGGGINSVMAHADAMIEIARDEEFQMQFLEAFTAVQRVIDHFIVANSPGEARRIVSLQRMRIEQMPEGYWKERYRTELLARWSNLLDAPGVVRGSWEEVSDDDAGAETGTD